MSQADYDWCLANIEGQTFVMIVDLNLGNRSVTNDAEAVLTEILAEVPALDTYSIMYRDSDGTWDRMRAIVRNRRVSNVYFNPISRDEATQGRYETAWVASSRKVDPETAL